MTDEIFDDEEGNEEESFAEMLERSLLDAGELEPGKKIEATVLQIGAEWIFLDVGQKGEGVLAGSELLDAEGNLTVAVGDRISAYFLSRAGGELRFTTRLGGGSTGTEQLEEAWQSGIPVDGRIEKEIKGGYEVKLAGSVRAFCPYSQLSLRRQVDPEAEIGKSYSFKITQFGERGRNIVVSHREILEEERRLQRETLKETLQEGMVVKGTVTSIRDFGAFLDIGGIEGLLPISEIGYGRIEDINDVLAVDQQLEVTIKQIDWEKNRFSFSLRDTLADPWKKVGTIYREGMRVTGKVSRLAQFGAFVTLEDGIDGLLHISKLGEGKHIRHPQDLLKVGQELPVVIEKIDLEQRRIALAPAGSDADAGATEYSEQPSPSGPGMGTFADLLNRPNRKKGRK
ncbi:MAG TPA: 30S ribosomal protein S1 [Geopsychrobacteraceae bacterium]|jgi:small subunit ribosomal protein S1